MENVSFHINEGDRVGVVGPNGAGKSTLLKILTGEMSYDSG
ncbi:ATP-binding cassette domain-containing protein, partial [Acinetobacter sp. 163]|nr:ATP-binding cassette domain-containing protein [Acinetobacter sp. 163]